MSKVILSLFDYSGTWSKPYRDAGYDVYQIDIKLGIDILTVNLEDLPQNIYGILAAPPCTDFAASGARWWADKDLNGATLKSLELIDKTLEIIHFADPLFWALENPVGRLKKLRPELGEPWYFQPFWYGDPYTKKTGLWGNFNRKLPENRVEPVLGSKMHTQYGGKSEKTKEARSITPEGFAKSFFLANQ